MLAGFEIFMYVILIKLFCVNCNRVPKYDILDNADVIIFALTPNGSTYVTNNLMMNSRNFQNHCAF